MQSSITQNADNIELKVNKNGVIATINNSGEAVSINAGKINLNGVVTANSRFKILTDGSMVATNGTFNGAITGGSINIGGNFIVDSSGNMEAKNGKFVNGTLNVNNKYIFTSTGDLTAYAISLNGGEIISHYDSARVAIYHYGLALRTTSSSLNQEVTIANAGSTTRANAESIRITTPSAYSFSLSLILRLSLVDTKSNVR